MSSRPLPVFVLGLALGAAATWLALATPDASAPPDSSPPAAASIALTAWDWRAAPPRLAAREAEAALAAWLAMPTAPGPRANLAARSETLRALLPRLADADFPRLLSAIQGLSDEARPALRTLAFDAWADRDPAAAARWALAAGPDTLNLARQATRSWARRDALAALGWASAIADETLARDLSQEIVSLLPPADLPRALALLEARGPSFLDALAASIFRPLAKTDPVAAVRAFGPAMWRRGTEIWQLDKALAAWARQDLPAALAWMRAQPPTPGGEFSRILARLATDDAGRARLADAITSAPAFPLRQATLAAIVDDWAEKSPAAALAWLDTLDRDLRNELINRATQGYSPEHPEQNLPLILALPDSPNRDQKLAMILGVWAEKSPDATLAWIATQTDPAVARGAAKAHAAILGALAAESPTDAVREWQALQNPDARSASIGPIVEAWARTDPAAALQWGLAQPVQQTNLSNGWNQASLFRAWAAKDAPAALRWAEGQTDGKLRQNLIGSLGGDWSAHVPPSRAADLYAQIQNPTLRSEMLASHVGRWLTTDRPAAQAWLEKSTALTPEQAAALLTPAAK